MAGQRRPSLAGSPAGVGVEAAPPATAPTTAVTDRASTLPGRCPFWLNALVGSLCMRGLPVSASACQPVAVLKGKLCSNTPLGTNDRGRKLCRNSIYSEIIFKRSSGVLFF